MNKKLSQIQKDLLFGSLLGDGHLSPNQNGTEFRYRINHCAKDVKYIYQKFDILGDIVESPPTYYELPEDKRTNKSYKRYFFNTIHTPALRFYWGMFYRKVKKEDGSVGFTKVVPTKEQIIANLTPQAMAWWFMDDGSAKDPFKTTAMRISTDGFPLEQQNRLCNAIQERYDLKIYAQTKNKKKGIYNIYIPAPSAEKFVNIIKPFVIDTMHYKIPLLHKE